MGKKAKNETDKVKIEVTKPTKNMVERLLRSYRDRWSGSWSYPSSVDERIKEVDDAIEKRESQLLKKMKSCKLCTSLKINCTRSTRRNSKGSTSCGRSALTSWRRKD